MPSAHRPTREGVIAGILGATVVAVWFLIIDGIAGHALLTPIRLGTGLLSVFGTVNDAMIVRVVAYTIFHYAAFILAGIVLSYVVHRAESEPSVLVIFTLLFIIFELGFYGFVALLAETRFGSIAWYEVGIANVLAALAMGVYMWRTHPALAEEFRHALGGAE